MRNIPFSSPAITASRSTMATPYEPTVIFTPPVSFFTTLSLRSIIFPISKAAASGTAIPYLAAPFIVSHSLAEYNSVFVGIHPSFRHTPPMAFFSNKTVFKPPAAALSAAVYPAGPPPIMAISYLITLRF